MEKSRIYAFLRDQSHISITFDIQTSNNDLSSNKCCYFVILNINNYNFLKHSTFNLIIIVYRYTMKFSKYFD